MALDIPVVFLRDGKPAFLTSVSVDDGAPLATVAARTAKELAAEAGVTARQADLDFRIITDADAAALEADARHAVTSERQFIKANRVSKAFVESRDWVLVKLVGE